MTLLKFLDNIKRRGGSISLVEEDGYTIYNGTISLFSHWIHNMEYYKRNIECIYFKKDDETMIIVLSEE